MRAALSVAPAGIAVWRLGLEDQGIWSFAAKGGFPDESVLRKMETIEPGFGSLDAVKGGLASVRPGSLGERRFFFNRPLGLVDGQEMRAVPKLADITTWHAKDPKQLAITFDDGPDPIYTPKILDILAEKNVKATFYLVGDNAISNLDVVKRIYQEGHDLGNHTFNHAELYESSATRIAAELNGTQRLLQSRLGVTSVLFRAPYERAEYGFLEGSPTLIETVYKLGYLWGGFEIDTHDYLRHPSEVNWIVDDVISSLRTGDGSVILMHDAGGNREATLRSLPLLIDRLRAEGYSLVTTHELFGLPRDAVMPRVKDPDIVRETEASFRLLSIRTFATLSEIIPLVAIATSLLGLARLGLVMLFAGVQQRRRESRSVTRAPYRGRFAVIVPVHNEEAVACKTVRALLDATGVPPFEILVVDDGSTDDTAGVLAAAFGNDDRVRVIRKPNGGKASALNLGYRSTRADVVVAIDGDTVLAPDALAHLLQPFTDAKVGAVAGKVVVGNRVNLITRLQSLEYTVSQRLDRNAFEMLNAIGVVPGAIGAWRRKAVRKVGGYSTDTLAEDADLTVSIALDGWRIVSAPDALAFTEAPETLRGFMRQRFRWMFGMLQVAFKHSGAIWRRPTGVSLLTIPNIYVFQFGFTLLAPIMDVIVLTQLLLALASLLGFGELQSDTLTLVFWYWLVFQGADLAATLYGLKLDGERKNWRLLPLVFLQRITYRQLLYWTAGRALLTALRGALVGWGSLVRTGSVVMPVAPPTAVENASHRGISL
ncbi:Poly-beta-1,6-N-acetyl-D-glucosamine synthase [Methyloligella halotolerans]|uniref:Chitooligosaccharide deacetylase n=1 Tax=Methyloligella halotolerans TaxID=1177755 RepID=A0A1E2S089_9HYPH|nr:glycosyltransferase [Methyloligella halotolerans]ODA67729.1 Poly-beta-1,6-N-acetyl-D-glucosamine synthase [Methyloligella halotolerans]